MKIKQQLSELLATALQHACTAKQLSTRIIPEFSIERPSNPAFGDFSIDLAMVIAGQEKLPPRQVAQILLDHLNIPPQFVDHIEITGPGFINFYLLPNWLHEVVRDIHRQGANYGRVSVGCGKRVLVEYVSANPNGPLTVLHGRGAVIGDVLCNILVAAGYAVTREYYVNDAATDTQMHRLGESLIARYLQEFGQDIELPEDGYQHEYIREIARKIKMRDGDQYVQMPSDERLALFTSFGKHAMVERHGRLLAELGIEFDQWFYESTLVDTDAVNETLTLLKARGETRESEDALWLASTKYGDDQDRPLVRSNGKPTYLACDIAYHRNKFERGFDVLVDIWGPDHHGYVARTKAAMAALGYAPERLHILVYHTMRLLRDGEYIVEGKRPGDTLLLSDLVEQIGKDATRVALLQCCVNCELHLDLDIATKTTDRNPLSAMQNAVAQMTGILDTATDRQLNLPDPATVDLAPLSSEAEIALMRRLTDLPIEVSTAAELHEPHRLIQYAQYLARDLEYFYDQCPVLKAGTSPEYRDARLVLVGAAHVTLINVLALLGVSTSIQK